jgi:hypothetical protein
MSEEIFTSVGRLRPSRVLQYCLLPQLFRDAKAFVRAEACDALGPVLVFRSPRRLPFS